MLSLDLIITFLKQSSVVLLILFILFAVFMYSSQNSIIYVPELNGIKLPSQNPAPYKNPSQINWTYKEVTIKTKDNVSLHGWLIHKVNAINKTMIYFHENAGNIGFRWPYCRYIYNNLDMNILIVGYRGYGWSTGEPSEEGWKIDGETIAEWAFDPENERDLIDKNNIYLFGRSLGGAVAAHVAVTCSHLKFKAVIWENTFSSMADMVDSLYPIFKYIKGFMWKNKWETKAIIGKIKFPILFFRSEWDEWITKEQMELLSKSALSAKFTDYYVIKKGTHNEGFIHDEQGYRETFKAFIERVKSNYSEGKKEQ